MPVAPQPLDLAAGSQRLVELDEFDGCSSFLLDVPETIPQLGYGSHQFFRYYGKFPSVVGAEIVRRHNPLGGAVLDCYAGCGTTLVEAQHEGYPSYGVDLNPLAVLACNVKTTYHDGAALRVLRDEVLDAARLAKADPETPMPTSMTPTKLDKWFLPSAQRELAALRRAIGALPASADREFLVLAFLGIVRRVSTAFDGEVRPHVNAKKRPRSPFEAFARKTHEMIAALDEVETLRPASVFSRTCVADNRDQTTYASLMRGERAGLLVAHPPYLNSFNYLQVFSLEFAWSEGLPDVWGACAFSPRELRTREHRAWPATDADLVTDYYEDFRTTISAASDVLSAGGRVAVVIGDATIRGQLEPVHQRFWTILKDLGLTPVEIWFRTTHYGIGKYAYSHRADYHGAAEKRDAIMFFEKP